MTKITNPSFRKINSTGPAATYVSQAILCHLEKGEAVLWLVAGGSAIKIAVAVAAKLQNADLSKLTVSLTDERYGEPTHPDSNWRQLMEAGFWLPGANLQPVLVGQPLDATVRSYRLMLEQGLNGSYSIALAGIGPDGHTFGIKPGSLSTASQDLVVGYEWGDYTRITPTLALIKKINEVVVYAVGEEKWPQLDQLDLDIDPAKQPAQILKQLNNVVIFNDQKGEAV